MTRYLGFYLDPFSSHPPQHWYSIYTMNTLHSDRNVNADAIVGDEPVHVLFGAVRNLYFGTRTTAVHHSTVANIIYQSFKYVTHLV